MGFAFCGGSGPVARESDDEDDADTDASDNASEREGREYPVANKRQIIKEIKPKSRGGKGSARRDLGEGRREQPKIQIRSQKGVIEALRKRVRELERELERKWERTSGQEENERLHDRIDGLENLVDDVELMNVVEKMHGLKKTSRLRKKAVRDYQEL